MSMICEDNSGKDFVSKNLPLRFLQMIPKILSPARSTVTKHTHYFLYLRPSLLVTKVFGLDVRPGNFFNAGLNKSKREISIFKNTAPQHCYRRRWRCFAFLTLGVAQSHALKMVWSSEALASPPRIYDHATINIIFLLFSCRIISFYKSFAILTFLLIKTELDILKVSVQISIIHCV